MSKPKILLVNAPHNFGWPWGKGNFYRGFYEYLGTGYLASAMEKQDIDVEILDAPFHGFGPQKTAQEIKTRHFDVLGVSSNWQEFFPQTERLLNEFKEPAFPIILGGHFPTIAHRELLRDFPQLLAVGIGEAEDTLGKTVLQLAAGRPLSEVLGIAVQGAGHKNPDRPFCKKLDSLEFPKRPQAEWYRAGKNPGLAAASLLSSRGCHGTCSFCTIHSFIKNQEGPRWRARTPENVVDEIEKLQKDYGFTYFRFVDEDFFGRCPQGRERAFQIARLIVSRGIKMKFELYCRADEIDPEILKALVEAGLNGVYISLDAVSESDIELYSKGTTRQQMVDSVRYVMDAGIQLAYSFIFWHPYRKLSDIKEAFKLLDDAAEGNPQKYASILKGMQTGIVSDLVVLTGSPLEDKIREDGLLSGDYRQYNYGFTHTSTRVAYYFMKGYKRVRSVAQNISNTRLRPSTNRDQE